MWCVLASVIAVMSCPILGLPYGDSNSSLPLLQQNSPGVLYHQSLTNVSPSEQHALHRQTLRDDTTEKKQVQTLKQQKQQATKQKGHLIIQQQQQQTLKHKQQLLKLQSQEIKKKEQATKQSQKSLKRRTLRKRKHSYNFNKNISKYIIELFENLHNTTGKHKKHDSNGKSKNNIDKQYLINFGEKYFSNDLQNNFDFEFPNSNTISPYYGAVDISSYLQVPYNKLTDYFPVTLPSDWRESVIGSQVTQLLDDYLASLEKMIKDDPRLINFIDVSNFFLREYRESAIAFYVKLFLDTTQELCNNRGRNAEEIMNDVLDGVQNQTLGGRSSDEYPLLRSTERLVRTSVTYLWGRQRDGTTEDQDADSAATAPSYRSWSSSLEALLYYLEGLTSPKRSTLTGVPDSESSGRFLFGPITISDGSTATPILPCSACATHTVNVHNLQLYLENLLYFLHHLTGPLLLIGLPLAFLACLYLFMGGEMLVPVAIEVKDYDYGLGTTFRDSNSNSFNVKRDSISPRHELYGKAVFKRRPVEDSEEYYSWDSSDSNRSYNSRSGSSDHTRSKGSAGKVSYEGHLNMKT